MSFLYVGEVRIAAMRMGNLNNNCYLLVDPETLTSALIDAPADPARILQMVAGTHLRYILMTHRHSDHWGALANVAQATKAQVGIHSEDAPAVPVKPDFFLRQDDTLQVGIVPLRVLETPGHTPGSICFITGKHLFTGDTLFDGGPGHSDAPDAFRQEVNSITRALYCLPPETVVYPGHGPSTTIGVSKQEYAVFMRKTHPLDLCGDIVWKET